MIRILTQKRIKRLRVRDNNYGYDSPLKWKYSLSCNNSHGRYGFQTSWGLALAALTLLEDVFAKD
jgi:hypothetical protein